MRRDNLAGQPAGTRNARINILPPLVSPIKEPVREAHNRQIHRISRIFSSGSPTRFNDVRNFDMYLEHNLSVT